MEIPESLQPEADRVAMQTSLALMLEWLERIIDAGCDQDCPCGTGGRCAELAEEAREALLGRAVTVEVR